MLVKVKEGNNIRKNRSLLQVNLRKHKNL